MNDSEAVVLRFMTLLEAGQTDAAVELLTPDVVWKNTGLPTFRGKKVAGMLRDMEQRGIGFKAETHHIASTGDIVLTDRTDHLSYKRWESKFWVCGTFEIRDGRIALWDDHFAMGNFVAASLRGVISAVRR